MRNINKSEAIPILKKYGSDINSAIKDGFSRYRNEILPRLGEVTKRAKANLIRDIIIQDLKKINRSGLKVVFLNKNKEGLVLLILDGRLALRLKKIDKEKKSKNNKTKQTKSFLNQDLELEILDIVPTYCDLGYYLNETGTNLILVSIICRLNDVVNWDYRILPNNKVEVSSQAHLYDEEPVSKSKRISAKTKESKNKKKSS